MANPYQKRRTVAATSSFSSPQERYLYFIKTIVETQQVWGLFDDGWAIGTSSEGRNALAMWAGRSYASMCQNDFWASYAPTAISVETFIFHMLPYTHSKQVLLLIMMTPDGQSVFVEPNKMLLDLKHYLYEVYTQTPEFFDTHPDVPLPRRIRLHNELK